MKLLLGWLGFQTKFSSKHFRNVCDAFETNTPYAPAYQKRFTLISIGNLIRNRLWYKKCVKYLEGYEVDLR